MRIGMFAADRLIMFAGASTRHSFFEEHDR